MNALIKKHAGRITGCVLAATLGVAALPLVASAQIVPNNEITGTIQSINGTSNISVLDPNGYLDNVELHQGTIINPTGVTLAPGMNVTVLGYNAGGVFDANEIDTPYQYSGALPTPAYYGPGFWYPGFAYGYGPSFSLVMGNGPYVERHPWIGHWWVSTPVRSYVGVRWSENHPVYVAPHYVAPARPAPVARYNPAPATRYNAAPVARTSDRGNAAPRANAGT